MSARLKSLRARLRAAEQRLALLEIADDLVLRSGCFDASDPIVIARGGGVLTVCSGPLLDAWRHPPRRSLRPIRIVGSV